MNRTVVAWIAGISLLIGSSFAVGAQTDEDLVPLVTEIEALIAYAPSPPGAESASPAPLVVVILPGRATAVLLRPITEMEVGSYQVQAIAPEMIAQQLLAAALVIPVVTESDVAALPADILRYLKRAVNRISGFAVFSDVGFQDL